jgi:hypothetical protein
MRLLDVGTGMVTDDPDEATIIAAVRAATAGKTDAVILEADQERNCFLQLPEFGEHIEYCESLSGPIYSHDDTPQDLVEQMFTSYARGDDWWRTAVPWAVEIESV